MSTRRACSARGSNAIGKGVSLVGVTQEFGQGNVSFTNNSLDHMTVYRDAAVHTRESVNTAVQHGQSFIDQCAMLDERMKGVQQIAAQLGVIDIALTRLETALTSAASRG